MSIAGKAVRGAAWNMVAGVGSRIVGLVGTIILTRFISPGETGEVAAAQISVLTAMLLTHASVGQSIIAKRVGPDQCFHAFVIHVLSGIVGLVTVVLIADPVGVYLDAPKMARFVPGYALAAFLERVAYVPGRVLVADMKFRTVALTRGFGEILFTFTSLALAPRFAGYAVVIGNLVRWAFISGIFVFALDRRAWFVPQRLRWQTARELLSFGLPISAGMIADIASSKWDNLLVSRFFGPPTMGAYNLAYNLADTPTINVADHIGDVLLPSFTKMDLEHRKAALVRSATIMALLVFPLSVGLAAVAPTLVHTLFDRRWVDIAPMLMILSSLSVVRPMTWTLQSFIQAQQRPRALMLLGLFKLSLLFILIVSIGRLGPRWTCVCVGIAFGAHSAAMLWTVQKLDGVRASRFLTGAMPPLLACAPMFAAVTAVRHGLYALGMGRGWMPLAVQIVAGAIVYVAAAFLIARPIVDDVLNLVRNALKRR